MPMVIQISNKALISNTEANNSLANFSYHLPLLPVNYNHSMNNQSHSEEQFLYVLQMRLKRASNRHKTPNFQKLLIPQRRYEY